MSDDRKREALEKLWSLRFEDKDTDVSEIFHAMLKLAEAIALPPDADPWNEYRAWRDKQERRY